MAEVADQIAQTCALILVMPHVTSKDPAVVLVVVVTVLQEQLVAAVVVVVANIYALDVLVVGTIVQDAQVVLVVQEHVRGAAVAKVVAVVLAAEDLVLTTALGAQDHVLAAAIQRATEVVRMDAKVVPRDVVLVAPMVVKGVLDVHRAVHLVRQDALLVQVVSRLVVMVVQDVKDARLSVEILAATNV